MARRNISSLKLRLNEMRLKNEFTDVTFLTSDEKFFRLHTLVLKNSSPYFKNAFARGPFSVAGSDVCLIPIDSKTFETIVEIIYLENYDTVKLDDINHVQNLTWAAFRFKIWSVFEVCYKAMEELFKVQQNFESIAKWITLFGNNERMNALLTKYIRQHGDAMFNHDEYLGYSIASFGLFLDRWDSTVPEVDNNTKKVAMRIIAWAKHDQSRETQLTYLLAKLPAKYLPAKFVNETLLAEDINNTRCDVLLQLLENLDCNDS